MRLKDWRIGTGWSQAQLGRALGFPAESAASQAERIENGKIKVDADLIAAIDRLTSGAVIAGDMQETRLGWLEASGRARAFPNEARSSPGTGEGDHAKHGGRGPSVEGFDARPSPPTAFRGPPSPDGEGYGASSGDGDGDLSGKAAGN